ncbi:hypothetical protein HDU93_008604 [Gonapodya sp. JEL0774]|nr:hypothetical protein HDU93_008604 [Gonapodya sp. JEL0774]
MVRRCPSPNTFVSSFLVVFSLLLFSPVHVLSARYCSYAAQGVCINGTATADGYGEFVLTFPVSVQYFAFGIGTDMPGSDIIAFWVASDGTFVVSDKYGVANAEPPTDTTQDVTVLTDSYIESDTTVVIHWRRKLVTGPYIADNLQSNKAPSLTVVLLGDSRDLAFANSAANYIWAWKYGSRLSSKSLTTVLGMHDVNENLPSLNLFDPAVVLGASPPTMTSGTKTQAPGSTATASSSSSGMNGSPPSASVPAPAVVDPTSMENLDTRSILLRVHGYLLAFTWGVAFPIAVFIMRYHPKPDRSSWHALVSSFVIISSLVAFALSYSYNVQSSRPHFTTTHSKMGLAALIAALFQTLLGLYAYLSKHRESLVRVRALGRPVQHLSHVWLGRLVVPVLMLTSSIYGVQRYAEMYQTDPGDGYSSVPFFTLFWVALAVTGELSKPRSGITVVEKSLSTAVSTSSSSSSTSREDTYVEEKLNGEGEERPIVFMDDGKSYGSVDDPSLSVEQGKRD